MKQMLISCLIIEDDPDTRDALSLVLSRWGYATQVASTRDDASKILRYGTPDVILMDIYMQGCPVMPFLQAVSAIHPRPKMIAMSADHAALGKLTAVIDAHLRKPIMPEDLKQTMEELFPRTAAVN